MRNILIALLLLINISSTAQHRKHELGMTYTTAPPYYSCRYCHKEYSPYSYCDGYIEWASIVNKYGNAGADSLFMSEFNKSDTSCISSEILYKKSIDIGDNWLKTHKPGKYYLNETAWMHTDGICGGSNYAMGGRFNDSVLLADKWYKIIYDKKSKRKKK